MTINNGMIVVETQLPEDIFLTLQAYGLFKDVLEKETRQLLALRLYRERVLSLGKATRLAGLTRWEFIEKLAENDIPVLHYSPEELAAEFDAVEKLASELNS